MQNQITQIASIKVRCDKCNRKNDLISQCCVLTSQTINQICCHSCVKILQKQHKFQVEQICDILQECQQIKLFLSQHSIVELASNSIFVNTLNISDPLKQLLENSKEFYESINFNETDFQNYCKNRIFYKQLLENETLKQNIEIAYKNLKSIIKQYFYDEEGIPILSISIPKTKYSILYSQVLSHYFLILKYQTQSGYLSEINNKKVEKQIKIDGYDPTIIVSIFDFKSKTNIYEDVLIQTQNLKYLTQDLIKSYILEQSNIIYVCVENDYYQINLNPKSPPKQINYVNFQVIGENLIFLAQNALLKFDPIDYEIIQKQEIFERNWSNNEFLISYDKKINSFIIYHQPCENQNEIFEIIQLNSLQCSKRIIFANFDRYQYNTFSYYIAFKYIFRNKIVVLLRETHQEKKFLILLNLETAKIIRKIPILNKHTIQNINLLKDQSVISLKYDADKLELYQISTGRQIIQFDKIQLNPILLDEYVLCIKQDDIKLFELSQ
ncbi:unnamed protein product [Paramecium sonneborni]|uniref:Uncharacterized protein n=1 Tax=Paramecium sonneborni TaxID=65129 RepID=A0A8S1MFC4_9CILI|nr:unnamed protein product [Paramecium sonneborni]